MQRQWEMLRPIPGHDLPGRTAAEVAAALSMRGYEVTDEDGMCRADVGVQESGGFALCCECSP